VVGAWLVLRRAGLKGAAVAGRIGLVFGGVGLVAAALIGDASAANGPAPRVTSIGIAGGWRAGRRALVRRAQLLSNTFASVLFTLSCVRPLT
jgi:hypothetical protein